MASEAHGLVSGDPDECSDAFHTAVKAQQDKELVTRGPAGERWNVRDEDEATRRLPTLSVMFPLSADSSESPSFDEAEQQFVAPGQTDPT